MSRHSCRHCDSDQQYRRWKSGTTILGASRANAPHAMGAHDLAVAIRPSFRTQPSLTDLTHCTPEPEAPPPVSVTA